MVGKSQGSGTQQKRELHLVRLECFGNNGLNEGLEQLEVVDGRFGGGLEDSFICL
jgi:hypothetical protein